jgi:hypothetical protein
LAFFIHLNPKERETVMGTKRPAKKTSHHERKTIPPDALAGKTYFSSAEAAAYLGCSRSLLDKARVYGLPAIPFTSIGRRIVYRKNDLDGYLADGVRVHRREITDGIIKGNR